jgi:hypothetical protein
MLDVMEKYGPMEKLEVLTLRNLSMGSLLIILPFAPNLKSLSLRYNVTRASSADDSAAPNLTDELFQKIFKRNKFVVRFLSPLLGGPFLYTARPTRLHTEPHNLTSCVRIRIH